MNPIIWCPSVSSLILFYIIPRIVNSGLKNTVMHVLFIIDICHMYFLVSKRWVFLGRFFFFLYNSRCNTMT
jgi:hypothetical protein